MAVILSMVVVKKTASSVSVVGEEKGKQRVLTLSLAMRALRGGAVAAARDKDVAAAAELRQQPRQQRELREKASAFFFDVRKSLKRSRRVLAVTLSLFRQRKNRGPRFSSRSKLSLRGTQLIPFAASHGRAPHSSGPATVARGVAGVCRKEREEKRD